MTRKEICRQGPGTSAERSKARRRPLPRKLRPTFERPASSAQRPTISAGMTRRVSVVTLCRRIPPFEAEERLQHFTAFGLHDTAGGEFHVMIYPRQIVEIRRAAETTHLRIGHRVTNAF